MTMSGCMLVIKRTNESRISAWAHGLSTWMMDRVSSYLPGKSCRSIPTSYAYTH